MAEQNPEISVQENPQQETQKSSGSRQKRMAKRNKDPQQPAGLEAFEDHNTLAYLDDTTDNGKKLKGVIQFLKRSRIYTAISTPCTAYKEHIREFWKNAKYDKRDDRWLIISKVHDKNIRVTPEILREVLGFTGETAEMTTYMDLRKQKGIFKRCHYIFPVNRQSTLKTSGLPSLYRYLAYVLNLCLSPKQAGHDTLRDSIQVAFAALVLNADFSFSKMTFDHLVENIIDTRGRFLKYPRFLQLIINHQAPELPKQGLEEIKLFRMTDATMGKMFVYRKGTDGQLHKPVQKNLICHLKDVNYKCPEGFAWRNEDSDSEVEDLGVEVVSDSDDEDMGVGAVPKVGGTGEGSSTPGGETKPSGKLKTKRKKGNVVDEADEDVVIVNIDDYLKERKKKKLSQVKSTGETTSGSGPVEKTTRPTSSQPQPQTQGQTIPPVSIQSSGQAGSSSSGNAAMEADLLLLKTMMINFSTEQKILKDENAEFKTDLRRKDQTIEYLKKMYEDEKVEKEKLAAEVKELKETMEGLKEVQQLMLDQQKKNAKKSQKLKITEGEEGSESEDADDESDEAEDDDATHSEG